MYRPGTAFRGPPRSCELPRTRAEVPAQRPVHNRRPGFGGATTLLPRSLAPPRASRTARSTPHERLQTGRPVRASLPAEPGLPHVPIAHLLLSRALDTPTSELPGARTIPGPPILPGVGALDRKSVV